MMPSEDADGLRLDRQANAPDEDTARVRDRCVCGLCVRLPRRGASALSAGKPGSRREGRLHTPPVAPREHGYGFKP